jgi:hypothetical protein
MTTADLILKAGAIALVTMLGATAGRVAFLLMTAPDMRYWASAAAIEFLWVAPWGAVPAAALSLALLRQERRAAIRQLKRLGNNPRLTTDEAIALATVQDLLTEVQRETR